MTPERWEAIKALVKDKFPDAHETSGPLPNDIPGTMEVLEFSGPMGRMKLEWTDQALRVDSKTLGSRRIGGSTTVVETYSEDERVHRFSIYRQDPGTGAWTQIKPEGTMFSA